MAVGSGEVLGSGVGSSSAGAWLPGELSCAEAGYHSPTCTDAHATRASPVQGAGKWLFGGIAAL